MELTIRKIGNSAGIFLPPALLRSLNLSVGKTVRAVKVGSKLVLTPKGRSKYLLADLIAQCNPNAPVPKDVQDWEER